MGGGQGEDGTHYSPCWPLFANVRTRYLLMLTWWVPTHLNGRQRTTDRLSTLAKRLKRAIDVKERALRRSDQRHQFADDSLSRWRRQQNIANEVVRVICARVGRETYHRFSTCHMLHQHVTTSGAGVRYNFQTPNACVHRRVQKENKNISRNGARSRRHFNEWWWVGVVRLTCATWQRAQDRSSRDETANKMWGGGVNVEKEGTKVTRGESHHHYLRDISID